MGPCIYVGILIIVLLMIENTQVVMEDYPYMRSLLDRVLFMIGIQVKRRLVMNVGAHNAGFITYIAILTMSFFIIISFYGAAYRTNM